MKLPKQKTHKTRKIILIAAAGLVVLAAIVTILELTHVIDLYKKPGQGPTEAQKNDPNTGNDKTTLPDNAESQSNSNFSPAPRPKPDNPESPSQQPQPNLTITIVRAGQTGASQPVSIRAFISGADSATCRYTLTGPGAARMVKEVGTHADPTYTSCDALDIAIAEFPSGGSWRLEAVAINGGKSSPAITQDISVVK